MSSVDNANVEASPHHGFNRSTEHDGHGNKVWDIDFVFLDALARMKCCLAIRIDTVERVNITLHVLEGFVEATLVDLENSVAQPSARFA